MPPIPSLQECLSWPDQGKARQTEGAQQLHFLLPLNGEVQIMIMAFVVPVCLWNPGKHYGRVEQLQSWEAKKPGYEPVGLAQEGVHR